MEEEEGMEAQEDMLENNTPHLLHGEEQPLIPLQALHGMSYFQTMRVIGIVGLSLYTYLWIQAVLTIS